ncbi:hypothetical protein P7K49_028206 [Saguinus oedipus]|uniref:Uncharacterized protein n=1 Tax=Saguinus oedipus TaxID=9490 RepID=A0ABQ9UBJ4_SAGOE|nr:hypothetical protein P7K49_028206 [Saguinus oedipus]
MAQLNQYFDAVKNAQHVEVESIPLPDVPHASSNILIQDIPLPGAQPPSILKENLSLWASNLGSEMKTRCIVLNLLSEVMMMMFLAPDDGYPEDMDEDKHDDSTDDSDTNRSDGESVRHDDGERGNNE